MGTLNWYQERNKRNRNLTLLGMVLCLGWIMPIVKPDPHRQLVGTELEFPTITMLMDSGAPPLAIAINVIPLLAGIVLIALSWRRYSSMRGLTMIGLTTTTMLLFVSILDSGGLKLSHILSDPNSIRPLTMILTLMLSTIFILVGLRMRAYRPDRKFGPALALLGAMLYAAAVLAPMMPEEFGVKAYSDLPFKLFLSDVPGERQLGVYVAIELGLMLLTCMMCILLFLSPKPGNNRSAPPWCTAALLCWVGSRIFAVIAVMTQVQISSRIDHAAMLTSVTKSILTGGGMLILFCAGVTDLALGPPEGQKNVLTKPA